MKRIDISLAVMLTALGAGVSESALAQQQPDGFARDRNVGVRARAKPEYDAVGVRAGAFRLYPELVIGAEYNDNVFALDTAEEEDTIVNVAPQVALRSMFSNHELNFSVAAPTRFYSEYDEQNATDLIGTVNGRLDVYRDLQLFGGASYSDLSEPLASSPTTLALAEPVKYKVSAVNVGATKAFNRLRLSSEARYSVFDYDDGVLTDNTVIEQDDRDREVLYGGVRMDYAISPSTALFVSATGNWRVYDLDPPIAPVERDSDGYEVLVGANFDITRLITGEIGVGYLNQTYDDPGTEDSTGLALRARVEWFPDELVTVSMAAAREVQDAGAFGAASYIANNATVAIDYEWRRDVILGVQYDRSYDDYSGFDRQDTRWDGVVKLDYAMNRGVSLFAEAGHYEQTSEGLQLGREYVINRAVIGIKLRR